MHGTDHAASLQGSIEQMTAAPSQALVAPKSRSIERQLCGLVVRDGEAV